MTSCQAGRAVRHNKSLEAYAGAALTVLARPLCASVSSQSPSLFSRPRAPRLPSMLPALAVITATSAPRSSTCASHAPLSADTAEL